MVAETSCPPSIPGVGGRTVPISVMWRHRSRRDNLLQTQVGELILLCICCSSGKSGPYTSTGQHSRADFEGVSVGEPTLRM